MKIIRFTSILWGPRFAVLLLMMQVTATKSHSSENVAAFGVEASSGNTALHSITLADGAFNKPFSAPDNPTSGRTGDMSPMKSSVIARGIIAPSPGINNTVLYWKGFRLWRASLGTQREILNLLPGRSLFGYMGRLVEPLELNKPNHIAISVLDPSEKTIVALLLPKDAQRGELDFMLPTEFAPPKKDEPHSEPIQWVDAKRLLAREYQVDGLERLKSSRLVLYSTVSLEAKKDEIQSARKRMTNLPDGVLEILAAPFATTVAMQTYDESTKKFRLGTCSLKNQSSEVTWLPLPTWPKNEADEAAFNRRFTYLKWSPSGRYLTVGIPQRGVAMWDAKDQKWLMRGKNIYIYREPCEILWLDEDRVLGFTPSMDGSSFVLGGRVSEFSRGMTILGELQGIDIRNLFRITASKP